VGMAYTFPASGSGSLKANDTDGDNTNDQLHVAAVTPAAHGFVDLNDDGSVTYTPAPTFSGDDTFTYTISDGLLTSTATVTMTVGNRPPTAIDDSLTTAEDTALIVAAPGVMANDTDPDGDALQAVLVSGPAHGALALNADGSFTYVPAALFFGADAFTYKVKDTSNAFSNVATVSMTVTFVDHAPAAAADGYSTVKNQALSVAAPGVLANDRDADDNSMASVLAAPTTSGVRALHAGPSLSYSPTPRFLRPHRFPYAP